MMFFLGLRVGTPMKNLRGFRNPRPALSPMKMPSMPQAAKKLMEDPVPAKIRVEQPRKRASASERKTNPTELPRQARSGRSLGGKTPPRPSSVGHADTSVGVAPVFFKGPQKNTVISHMEFDANSPPPPIELTYEVGQTGSPRRLNEYKKMYKGSTYELPTPTLEVGGVDGNAQAKFRPSTMAGFGRKNVVWPYWLHDYYSNAAGQLTSKTSCFNRFQIEELLESIWMHSGMSEANLDAFWDAVENATGGDQRIDFPLDYIECEYKYFNNNIAMPIDLSLYICTPLRDMTSGHSPMYDWFNPGTGRPQDDQELMFCDYYYEPVITAAQNVMFTNNNGTLQSISINANKNSVLTASTEVVPEATPQGFSVRFRRNWDVLHVQPVVLMPQQELKLTFRVKMSKLLDLKRMLAYDSNADKYQLFKDLTMFPMVTFQGQDTTAVSKGLQRSGVTDMNRFLDTTAPRSSASMLSSSMTARARVHTKTAPIRNFGTEYTYNLGDILDTVSVSKRQLLPYNDPERGQQCPYYQVNDNLGYFIDKTVKPGTGQNYYLSQLTAIATKQGLGVQLPSSGEPADLYLTSIDTDSNWGKLESKTVARTTVEKTSSDIAG